MAKAKKSKAKKSKAKKPVKKARKAARGKAGKKTAKKAKKSKAPARKAAAPAKKTARKAPAKKARKKVAPKQIVGEGDYAASRKFLKDQAGFVKRNESKIPAMGKAAEQALEGPEGDSLRAAEEAAKSHSKTGPEE